MRIDGQTDSSKDVKTIKIVAYIRVGRVEQLCLEDQEKHLELIGKKSGKGIK